MTDNQRYLLPLIGTHKISFGHDYRAYAMYARGRWQVEYQPTDEDAKLAVGGTITKQDLVSAPAWVKAITPVEI